MGHKGKIEGCGLKDFSSQTSKKWNQTCILEICLFPQLSNLLAYNFSWYSLIVLFISVSFIVLFPLFLDLVVFLSYQHR